MPRPSSTAIRLPNREADAGAKNGPEDAVRCVKIQVMNDAFRLTKAPLHRPSSPFRRRRSCIPYRRFFLHQTPRNSHGLWNITRLDRTRRKLAYQTQRGTKKLCLQQLLVQLLRQRHQSHHQLPSTIYAIAHTTWNTVGEKGRKKKLYLPRKKVSMRLRASKAY
jgi:hypothetical protein